jgi:ubiquinone/menaquinone biosynthesis C-methylase UbiE
MSKPLEPTSEERRSGRIPYFHGSDTIEQRRLARRTAATSAGFFLPHLRPGMRVLDCGCGPGSITVGLAETVAPGEVVGLDIQPAQVERARALAAERGVPNVRFEVGSVNELPFPDASFDAAFAMTVVEHVRQPLRALREMKRVLKPGGVVGIADDDGATVLWEPRTSLLTQALGLFLRLIEYHGGNPYGARHNRQRLLQAGFARPIATASIWGGGVWGTPEETRDLGAWFADQLSMPTTVEVVTSQGWAGHTELDAIYAELLTWGERPDAYFAVMGVAAVGWVDDEASSGTGVAQS